MSIVVNDTKKKNRLGNWIATIGGAAATLLSGCVKLDAPVLPNVNLKAAMPGATDPVKVNITNPLPQSKQDTKDGDKELLASLVISDDAAKDFDKDNTCFQLVKLRSSAVVVDASSTSCPGGGRNLISGNIEFSASYRESTSNTYTLSLNGRDIGEMELNEEGNVLTLTQLCTGRYFYYCRLNTSSGRISGIPIVY